MFSKTMTRQPRLSYALALSILACALSVNAQQSNTLALTSLSATPNGWILGWESSLTDTAYTVQFQDSLQDGIWRLPASETPFPVTSNQWLDPTLTNSARLYRVLGVPAAQRGKVLSSSLQKTMSTLQLGLLFALGGVPVTPRYSVRLYKVVYETIDPWGGRTQASGAMLLPEKTGQLLPLVGYQHGTITQRDQAPSSLNVSGEVTIGIAFASVGYAAAVPDYLGLGDSPGLHPLPSRPLRGHGLRGYVARGKMALFNQWFSPDQSTLSLRLLRRRPCHNGAASGA